LIEYREPTVKGDTCGYAFLNTELFYTSLSDFIRYYSLVTMKEHSECLDTTLRIPVLRYLASVRKRRRTEEEHGLDEEETLLLSAMNLDQADAFFFDDDDFYGDIEAKLRYS
jgi:hypothetical protein